MAESGLSIGFTELKQEVGSSLGHGRGGVSFADWTARTPDPTTEVEALVQSGVRRVYYPLGIPGIVGHEWSWLRPSTTLLLGASGTDGTITGDQFDSATYTDWTTQGITTADQVHVTAPTAAIGTYDIASVAAGAITLTTSPGDATSLTFAVKRSPANYDLPDSFGRLIGELHFAPDDNYASIQTIPLDTLLEMRSREDREDVPLYCAVRPKAEDRTTGQRWEILFWPRLDTSYTLYYTFEAYSGALSASYPYPLGGMSLAELYIESCLAVAEQRINDEAGLHTQAYQALLIDAVERDRKRSPKLYGYMGHSEDAIERRRHGDTGGVYPLTYKGSLL
jgi:hypothetical protein